MTHRQTRLLELIARLPRLDRLVTRYLQPFNRTAVGRGESTESHQQVSDSE